jgi:HK97 family phage major capsid protein
MKNLKEMRAARAAKAKRGQEATVAYNLLGAMTGRTAEQDGEMTTLGAELDTLEAEVANLDQEIVAEEAAVRRAGLFGSTTIATPTAQEVRTFGSAARTSNEGNPETTGGFKGLPEFAACVVQASAGRGLDQRLLGLQDGIGANAPGAYQQNQGSGGEGFLVPPDFSKKIWELAVDDIDLMGLIDPEPTSSNAVGVPKDETTPWGAAGVQAYWAGQGQQLQPSKAQVTGNMMQLHKLYAFVAATDEVLADAPMLQDRLTKQAGRAIGWHASDSIMWGDGVGMPLGFMNAGALVTVPKDNAQAAKSISINNILNIQARVLRAGGRPVWLANTDVMPSLGSLVIGQQPAYLASDKALSESPFDGTLGGYPVLFTEHSQTCGTPGDLVCASLQGYYAATKVGGGVDFASSIHLYFDMGMTAFRWTFRMAGQPYLSKPVIPAKSANTKSHFVALAQRA